MLFGSIPVNTLVASAEGETEPTYVNVLDNENISLHGVTYGETEQAFIRMDSETAAGIANTESLYDEDGAWVNTVYSLAREAAGGRIRFQTNSTYVAIKATLTIHDASHLSHGSKMEAAKYGFDVYVDSAEGSVYAGTVCGEAPTKNPDGSLSTTEVLVEGTVNLGEAADRDLTIYFPITSETKSVEIRVAEGSTIAPHETDYTEGKHLVFYGSSITQGGAVTKPGNTYVNTVGRNMNMEYTNFGMWGRCKGEPAFANYIAGLGNISAFVYDFDHNISKVSLMEPVHYPFYETVRAAYPDIPIIMITRPGNNLDNTAATDPSYSTTAEMKEVIYKSYQKAVAAGDENVHFIDGESFFGYSTAYMADGSHPNDAGQARMAAVVTDVLERALAGEKNIIVTPGCDQLAYNYDFEDDAKAEDGEDNSGATGWNVTLQQDKYTDPMFDVVTEDGNNAFRLQYTRTASSVTSGAINDEISLSGTSDFTIEMKATVYKNNRWPYIGLGIIDSQSNNYRLDVRLIPDGTGCQVACFDRTDASGTNQDVWAEGYDDTFEFSDLSNQYDETQETFTYNLKVEVETADIPSNDGKDLLLRVYVGHQESEGQEPVYQEPVVFKVNPKNASFTPEKLGLFLFVNGNGNIGKVTVDDLNVYKPGEHTISPVAEIPATTEEAGKDAHYVCSSCGQLYLDANGVLKATDEELTIPKRVYCVDLIDQFETDLDVKSGWDETNCSIEEDDENGLVLTDSTTGNAHIATGTACLDKNSDVSLKMNATIYRKDSENWSYMGVWLRRPTNLGYEIIILPNEDGYEIKLRDKSSATTANNYGAEYTKTVTDEKFAAAFVNTETEKISYDLHIVMDGNEGHTSVKFHIWIDNNAVETFELVPVTTGTVYPTGMRVRLYSTDSTSGRKIAVNNFELYKINHSCSTVSEVPATETTTGTKAHYVCSECNQKFLDEACTIVVTDEELTIPKRTFCVDLCEAFDVDLDSLDGWTPSGSCSESQGDDGLVFAYSGTASSAYFSAATAYLDKNTDFSFKTTATIYKDDSGDWSYMGIFFRNGGNNQGPELRLIPNETGYELMLCDRTTKSVGSTYTKTVEDDGFATLFAEGTKISYNLHVIMDANDDNSEVKFHVWVDDNAVETFEFVPDVTGVNPPTATRIFLYSTGGGVGHKVAINNTVAYKTTHDTITAVETVASTDTVAGVKAHYKCSDCEKKFMDEEATVVATDAALAYATLKGVLYQTRPNQTNTSNTDLRFVAYVDDYTKYSGVKFTITSTAGTGEATTKKVYSAIYADNELLATSDVYGVTEKHFATFILKNCTDELLQGGLTVKVEWISTDGNVIDRGSRELTYNDLIK